MVERGQHAGFALEARQALGVAREFRGQDLQGYLALEFGVGGAVHLAHAALPEQSNHLVMFQPGAWREGH